MSRRRGRRCRGLTGRVARISRHDRSGWARSSSLTFHPAAPLDCRAGLRRVTWLRQAFVRGAAPSTIPWVGTFGEQRTLTALLSPPMCKGLWLP